MSKKVENFDDGKYASRWKRRKKKAEDTLQEASKSLSRDSEGKPISGPHYSNRAMRRPRLGSPKRRIYSETMKIPKGKR